MGNTEEDENGSETSTEDDGETSLESSKVEQIGSGRWMIEGAV